MKRMTKIGHTKITAEMMGGWQGCAVSDDEFAILEAGSQNLAARPAKLAETRLFKRLAVPSFVRGA